VKVNVNGRDVEVPSAATVTSMLDVLGLEPGYALVERNGEPVERRRYQELELEEGDRLLVARPVAGG
jgi:thiamine biosynthesis protein ThiS